MGLWCAPPKSRRYVYTGFGEVSSLITDRTPVIPCYNRILLK